jgi:hypothetical protein
MPDRIHVALLGDSIFDNAAYVAGGPDVVRQLNRHLDPHGGRASLLAVDGAIATGVLSQLGRLPDDATHLVVSAGGNDALGNMEFLFQDARTVAGVLNELGAMASQFEESYGAVLSRVLAKRLPTAVCTIYYPRFPEAHLQQLAVTALTVFNDVILRSAFAAGLPVLDLRLICDEWEDYANPIEPSVKGGEKIAAAIARLLRSDAFTAPASLVFGSEK